MFVGVERERERERATMVYKLINHFLQYISFQALIPKTSLLS